MAGCAPRDPLVEGAVLKLDDTMATRAHEVVVVVLAAQAVAKLTAVMGERVDHAPFVEQGKSAVDGGKTDGDVPRPQPLEQLLGRRVVFLPGELFEDADALTRHPDIRSLEQLFEADLRGSCHGE